MSDTGTSTEKLKRPRCYPALLRKHSETEEVDRGAQHRSIDTQPNHLTDYHV